MSIFNDVEKEFLYSVICECGVDHAKKMGKDEKTEDVVLINDLLEDISRYNLVDVIVDKLREKGYKISK
jgi:hypothetical protein